MLALIQMCSSGTHCTECAMKTKSIFAYFHNFTTCFKVKVDMNHHKTYRVIVQEDNQKSQDLVMFDC